MIKVDTDSDKVVEAYNQVQPKRQPVLGWTNQLKSETE